MRFVSRTAKCTGHQNVLCERRLAGEDFSLPNKRFLFHLAPRANFPVGCVRAVPEEARPGARRVRLGAMGAGRGGLGSSSSSSVRVRSLGGGNHGAGDNTLLVANTTAGRALSHTQIHTHTQRQLLILAWVNVCTEQ